MPHFRLKKTSLAILMSCLTAYATADGYRVPEEPELWTGPYMGVYVGGGTGSTNTSYHSSVRTSSIQKNSAGVITSNSITQTFSNGSLSGHATGSFADVFIGYNIHQSNRLVGAQLEGNFFNNILMESSGALKNAIISRGGVGIANTVSTISTRTNLKSMLSFIGRIGFLPQPHLLMYGLIGPTEGLFDNQWQLGVSAGAGLEYKINARWSIMTEYRRLFFNIGSSSSTSNPTVNQPGNNIVTNTSDTNLSGRTNLGMNIGKIGIVFRY